MAHPGPAGDIGRQTSALIRSRHDVLAADVATALQAIGGTLKPDECRACASLLLRLFASGVERGSLDTHGAAMRDLARYCPPLTTRQLLDAVHQTERVILDELALDNRAGAATESWTQVANAIRRGTVDIFAAYAEQIAGSDVPVAARDPLTTLIAAPVFHLALEQEIQRALRHHHALAVLLFDIDDLSHINREHGWGVGDRLLERTGILARQFFRTHDWVARHGHGAIAVLLPETTMDQAAGLAAAFREMVQHRLVLQDHKTDAIRVVTLSTAVVGTDLVQSTMDARAVMAEAEAAAGRAKLHDRGRIERVALQPTSLTIFGASTMLGVTPREVTQLIRNRTLTATRRGRHLHIERDLLDSVRKSTR